MTESISKMLNDIKSQGRTVLTYEESRKVMELAGLPLNKMVIAKDLNDCIVKANEIGYPIVLKVISEDVLHKTEVGGVKVGIKTEEELRAAQLEMEKNVLKHYPNAKIEGYSIEEMVKGVELLIGQTTDIQFGKMLALGIGGIFVEIYKDVAFRLIPINESDVKEMYHEIVGRKMFEGFRGMPKIDMDELTTVLMNISKLVETNSIIKEMDLNPVMVTEKGLVVIDARIILE